jgi:hypothetical protein
MNQLLKHPRNTFIVFDPEQHVYFYNLTEKFDGVTGWISKYKQPFNREAISMAVARRDGKSQDQVLSEWDDKRDTSAAYGNFAHNAIERWVNGQRRLKGQKEYIDLVKPVLEAEGLRPISAEFVVYDEDIERASPIDLLCVRETTGKLVVVDIKTYEKGVEWQGYKDAMLLYPLHHLPDANFYHTSLQTGLYVKWLKEKYECEVEDEGYILHLRPPQCSLVKCVNTQKEVELMYEELKNN